MAKIFLKRNCSFLAYVGLYFNADAVQKTANVLKIVSSGSMLSNYGATGLSRLDSNVCGRTHVKRNNISISQMGNTKIHCIIFIFHKGDERWSRKNGFQRPSKMINYWQKSNCVNVNIPVSDKNNNLRNCDRTMRHLEHEYNNCTLGFFRK